MGPNADKSVEFSASSVAFQCVAAMAGPHRSTILLNDAR